MALTLGEKLRQAREERGLTLSNVAEQTRISSSYLESIENDDYRILPGGIFNKGFVKSYAKFVGINEQEALMDYSRLLSDVEMPHAEEPKRYRPEVLTDDRSSMVPTAIVAILILGAMTAGILYLVRYLREPSDVVASNVARTNTNTAAEAAVEPANGTPTENSPYISSSRIVFKALSQPVSLTAVTDGKSTVNNVAAGTTAEFSPKESLKLTYSKSLANFVQLTINDRSINLPSQPLVPRRSVIEFEINKDNFAQIWKNSSITGDTPPADVNAAAPTSLPSAPIRTASPPATPKSTPAVANTAKPATSPAPKASPVAAKPTPKT